MRIPCISPTLLKLLLTIWLTKHSSSFGLPFSMLIPPKSPVPFFHLLVKWWGFFYLCVPGSLLYCQSSAVHLWAPNFKIQTFLLNFKIWVSTVHQDYRPSPLSSHSQRVPTGTYPSSSLPHLASTSDSFCYHPHSLSWHHCLTGHTNLKPWTPTGLFPISHYFPFLVFLTHTHSLDHCNPSPLCYFHHHDGSFHHLSSGLLRWLLIWPSPSSKPLNEWPFKTTNLTVPIPVYLPARHYSNCTAWHGRLFTRRFLAAFLSPLPASPVMVSHLNYDPDHWSHIPHSVTPTVSSWSGVLPFLMDFWAPDFTIPVLQASAFLKKWF